MRSTRPLRTTLAATAALAAATLLLSSCGGDPAIGGSDPSTVTTPTTSAPATSTPSVSSSPGATDLPAPTKMTPVTAGSMATPASLLTSIRVAHHSTYDRVVFEFSGKLPGYRVAYVPQVVMDASGEPVALKGSHFLQVVFQGATLDTTLQQGSAGKQYTGPKRITPLLPAVQEIVFAGDFEAVLSWGIGIAGPRGFRVVPLSSPTRLAVDIAVP